MEILIATRNEDKFQIARRLVEDIVPDVRLVSLAESKVEGDVVEVGTVQERAVQKARYFSGVLEKAGRHGDFEGVLAIDDGISVGDLKADPNSKEITDRILSGEWPAGTGVTIVRAYALMKLAQEPLIITTEVPFVFRGRDATVRRESGRYPLSYVLAPVGSPLTVAEMSAAEQHEYNRQHSYAALSSLFAH